MAPRSSFLVFFCILLVILLSACTTESLIPPTADQKTIATAVAATLDAVTTAIQATVPTLQPIRTIAPSPAPTQLLPTSTPSVLPSPTVAIPTGGHQRIAYTKNGDVYLWASGRDPVRLTDLNDVISLRLSKDGKLVAFQRQNADNVTLQELWVVNTEGAPDPRMLVSSDDLATILPPDPDQYILGAGILDFTWRPNTHDVAYNTLILHEGPGFGPNYDLHIVDADTLKKSTIFEKGKAGLFYYSPDGSQIALSNPESISLVNADGTNLRKDVLAFPHVITYSEYSYHPHPTWADDSLSLGVVIPPPDSLADPLPDTSLWSIPADGSSPTLLGHIPAEPLPRPDNAFSPNLENVVYVTSVEGNTSNQRELHLALPDGSKDVIYTQGEALEFLSWSPDSQHFIYQINAGADEGVFLGGLASQPKQVIFDPHVISDIKWFGSNRLVFPFQDGTEWLLFIQNPDGGELTRIDILPDSTPSFDVLP